MGTPPKQRRPEKSESPPLGPEAPVIDREFDEVGDADREWSAWRWPGRQE
jgi:hypothetical protein